MKESKQLLTKLKDKEEWEVKIYADLKRIKDYVSKTNLETKRGELVQDELNKKLNEYKQKNFEWMRKQAQDAKLNEIPHKESNQKKSAGSIEKAMVLNSTYLVSKEKREDFTRVVRFLEEDYKEKGLEFECTGPKPPYNFLSVK
jgi:oligoribonuclease NrnB/cAMP/cGMP phosphodiesterase (DHH superfamily)